MMRMRFNRDAIAHLMQRIPFGSSGAEIGVWHGKTSLSIVHLLDELHLVDPWSVEPYREGSEHGTFNEYLARYTEVVGSSDPAEFQAHYDEIYAGVVEEFREWACVTIHRMTSDEWFDSFAGKLDWIYLDGDHSYQGCLNDLNRSLEVVKPGGHIFGDDFRVPRHKPGVYRAVTEFSKTHDLERFGRLQYQFTVN